MRGYLFIIICLLFTGWQTAGGNVGRLQSYATPIVEASWIRNGEPLEFEGMSWYPVDGAESLQDMEVIVMGEYRGVQFFVEKVDIRPFNRMYTKFSRNRFRIFEKKNNK